LLAALGVPREIASPMRRAAIPSGADLLFIVAAPIKATLGAVKLTQSDGDLAAHLRMGNVILSTRHIPAHSLASYTAAADPMVAHAWLSEVFLAFLFRAGGLPLVTVFTAIMIALTHALVAVFLRRKGVDPRWALLSALISLALGASHWLARPHMFSILASALTVFALESERRRKYLFFLPLFALWANLHGGWLFGLVLIVMYIAGDAGEVLLGREKGFWRARAKENVTAFVVAVLATGVNPYGYRLYKEVLFAVTSSSLANNIIEYLSPNFHDATNLPFLLTLILSFALLAVCTRRMPLPWLFVTTMSLFFALRSYRNVALFGVTAWPLIALHVSRAWPAHRRRFPLFNDFARIDAQTSTGLWSIPMLVLLLLVGLNHGSVAGASLIPNHWDRKKSPVDAVKKAMAADIPGRLLTPWDWGGYVMYAWPGKPLHVDPLKFNDTTMGSYTRITELWPGWQDELKKWQVQMVLTRPRDALALALALEPSWSLWYRDSTALIWRPAAWHSGPRATDNFR
jgi:hypothetical protein